jgi:hypothetical protein
MCVSRASVVPPFAGAAPRIAASIGSEWRHCDDTAVGAGQPRVGRSANRIVLLSNEFETVQRLLISGRTKGLLETSLICALPSRSTTNRGSSWNGRPSLMATAVGNIENERTHLIRDQALPAEERQPSALASACAFSLGSAAVAANSVPIARNSSRKPTRYRARYLLSEDDIRRLCL